MAVSVRPGPRTLGGERDDEGHRTFDVVFLCDTAITDGPMDLFMCPDLPQPGDVWTGILGGADVNAYFYPTMKVSIHEEKEGSPARVWKVACKASTKPLKRCQTTSIENPLAEPMKISGSFTKYTKEAFRDRFGEQIVNSSHERVHGPGVEFDNNRPSVKIEQNVAALELSLFSGMIDHLNDSTLWGLPKRCVKLSNASWERLLLGVCSFYYKRTFEFDIQYDSFDRWLMDEGNRVLHGEWAKDAADMATGNRPPGDPPDPGSLWKLLTIDGDAPDRNNPQHFIRYKDRNGEMSRAILNGRGEPIPAAPAGTATGTDFSFGAAGYIYVQYYPEANLLLLGIPTTL